MNAEGGFYVYYHRRADDGLIFYVGKGRRDRANSKRRTAYWNNVANKHGFTVEIIFRGTETECFQKEIDEIARLRKSGSPLVNMTSGGEGRSNPSADFRRRLGVKIADSWKDLVIREKRLLAHRLATSTAEFRSKAKAASLLSRDNPESKKKKSAKSKARWEDPNYRETIIKALKTRFSSAEAKMAHGEATKKALESPEIRARISKGVREAFNKNGRREMAALRMQRRNTNDDPLVGITVRGNSYRARIKHLGKNVVIGSFQSLQLAQQARRKAENDFWGAV